MGGREEEGEAAGGGGVVVGCFCAEGDAAEGEVGLGVGQRLRIQ